MEFGVISFSRFLLAVLLACLVVGHQGSLVRAFSTRGTNVAFEAGTQSRATTSGSITGRGDVTSETGETRVLNNSTTRTTLIGKTEFDVTDEISSTTGEASVDSFPMYIRASQLLSYGLPVLLALTMISNTMAVIVLQHPTFRGTPTGFILSALAVSDTLYIYTGLIRQWVYFRFDFDMRSISDFGCKFHLVIVYFSRQLSAWTVILLTFERVVAVFFPFQCKRLITLRRAVIAWCVIIVVLFGANSHFFGTAGLIPDDDGDLGCHMLPEFVYFLENQWYWVDAWIGDFFPFIVIGVGNVAILILVAIGRRRRAANLSAVKCNAKPSAVTTSRISSMTVTLIVVSVLFLVLNIPADVYFIGFARQQVPSVEYDASMWFFYAVVNFLLYTSNSINFIMYFVSGRKFRLAALDVICCRCLRKKSCPKSVMPIQTVAVTDRQCSMSTTVPSPRPSVSTVTSSVPSSPRPSLCSIEPLPDILNITRPRLLSDSSIDAEYYIVPDVFDTPRPSLTFDSSIQPNHGLMSVL